MPWPDESALRAFLQSAARRVAAIAVAEGTAAGFAIASVLTLLSWPAPGFAPAIITTAILVIVGVIARLAWTRGSLRRIAHRIERRAPASRNVIVTASELMEGSTHAPPYVAARVVRDAARIAATLDLSSLFPGRARVLLLTGTAALCAAAVLIAGGRPLAPPLAADEVIEAARIDGIDVTITSPAYTDSPPRNVEEPARIEALAGSRIRLLVRAAAAEVHLETIAGRRPLERTAPRTFAGEVMADADGYLAIEPRATDGHAGPRRLIGLAVTPDREPRVRITSPGRDLFLQDAPRSLDVRIEADDDLGLASLRLRYTKVSGSGEQFTFAEGEAPLAIARADARTWTARGSLPLDSIGLTAGDLIVYRGVAADRRPGAVPAESDAFLVEIASPGAVAAEGFAIDDEFDRYALSQQMVILKTERLIARAPSLPSDSLSRESLTLAAEQRSVRAEFVFMMGGELAEDVIESAGMGDLNEEDHVEADDEAIAGRLANQGRVALISAIRSMSRANAALNAVELERALVEEKAALSHLQNAFSRTRYILRALTQRERLDLSRRLTGELATAGRDVRAAVPFERDARTAAIRQALGGVAALAGAVELGPDAIRKADSLAAALLRADPASAPLHDAAGWLSEVVVAIDAGRDSDARERLDRIATALAALIRKELRDAPRHAQPFGLGRLDGALTDALRRPTGTR